MPALKPMTAIALILTTAHAPAAAQAISQQEAAALRAEIAALKAQINRLEARIGGGDSAAVMAATQGGTPIGKRTRLPCKRGAEDGCTSAATKAPGTPLLLAFAFAFGLPDPLLSPSPIAPSDSPSAERKETLRAMSGGSSGRG